MLVGTNGATVYLFDGSGNLLQSFTNPNPNGVPYDGFGESVATVGSDVLVGAWKTNGDSGAVYLFDGSGNLLQTFNGNAGTKLGWWVAANGSDALVGARE